MAQQFDPSRTQNAAAQSGPDIQAWHALGEWAAKFFPENFEQTFSNELGAYNRQEARQHLDELIQPTIERLQGELDANVVRQFIQSAGEQHDLNALREMSRNHPQWLRILGVLSQEMPNIYRDQILPKYFGGKQPLTDLDMGDLDRVDVEEQMEEARR